jgi:hypothetical protein
LLSTKPLSGRGINYLHPLARGLVAWWPFNEGSGSVVHDLVKGATGSFSGIASDSAWAGSIGGGAIHFGDVADSFMHINNLPDVGTPIGTGDITVSLWLYTTAYTAEQNAFYIGGATSNQNLLQVQLVIDGSLQFNGRVGTSGLSTASGPQVVEIGRWVHAAVIRTGTTGTVWINGRPGTSVTDAEFGASLEEGLYIGSRRVGTAAWIGSIANFRIYNRALSALEVQQLYADPYAALLPPPRRWASVAPLGTLSPGHTYQHRAWPRFRQSFT